MLFVKIKQQDLLYDIKNIPGSIAYFTRAYVIYIIVPRASEFDLQAEYENKVEKVVTTLKD